MNVGRGALAGCCALAVLILIAAIPGRASAQDSDDPTPSSQAWGDFRMVWPDDAGKWLFRLDLRPLVQFSGAEKWAEFAVVPAAVYQAPKFLDLIGDIVAGYTVQNDDVETLELAPRIGARVHLISDVRDVRPADRFAKRVGLATTLRLEHRHFWYYGSGTTDDYSNDWRFRARLETRIGLNRADRSQSGTWYLFSDAEAFVTLGDPNPETFAEKWRFRVGPGLTANRAWRFELLYIHDITRNTLRDDFDASVNAIDLRAHRFF
jgi:hypothetical protein